MDQREKLAAAKAHIAGKITDIIVRNFDDAGAALETPGTFTTLLEAYRAIEIAESHDTSEPQQDIDDYRDGILRNM